MSNLKYISLVITITTLLCMVSQNVMAEGIKTEGSIGGGIHYFYDTSTKEISIKKTGSGSGSSYLYGESPFVDYGIERATIGDGVLKIGHNLFNSCKTLKSVEIGDSVTYLYQKVFEGCTALTDVTLGKGITTLENSIFKNCTSLKNISFPDSITEMGNYDCSKCTSLRTVKLSKNLTVLPHGLFEGCTSLTKVELPDKLKIIDNQAFNGCKSLYGDLVIPDSVNKIGSRAFFGCTKLKSVLLSNNVETVGNTAFSGIEDKVYIDCLPGYRLMDDVSYKNAGSPKYLKDMRIADVDDINYTGGAVEPEISVSIENQMTGDTIKQLTEGKDYTITYINNDKVGTATASVTYIGDYADYGGDVNSINFKITGKSAERLIISPIPEQIYTGAPITPMPDIRDLD